VVVDAAAAFPANDGPGALDQSIPSFLSTPVTAEPAQARTVVNDTVPVEPPKRRHRIIGARLAVLAISLAGIGSLAGYEWGDPLVARPLAELRDAFPDLRVSVADLRDAIEARTRSVAAIFADTTDDRSPSVAAPIEPERHAAASRAPSPATSDEGDVAIGAGLLALDPAERAAAAAGADRPISTSIDDTRIAFGRFVHLMRRQRGFSIEKLADEAALEVGELVRIEEDLDYTPEPRTVYQLARTFDVPQQGLMQLAGLAVPKDAGFRQEAIRFAARSESIQKLSREEKAALDAFIAVLSQRQDR
jgi:transcriptional regulator with XRE-family HTH domain